MKPAFHYESGSDDIHVLHPSARLITYAGRSGITFTSIRGRAAFAHHTADCLRGTAAFWMLPLQDCAPATQLPAHSRSNPNFDRVVLLSDREAVQDIEAANFSLWIDTGWYAGLAAKFGHGTAHNARFGPHRVGMTSTDHIVLHALNWYHVAVTWDRRASVYELYLNGVKVGHSDTSGWPDPPANDPPAPRLYFGNPACAIGNIAFFDDVLTRDVIVRDFQDTASSPNPRIQADLEKTYEGRDLPRFTEPAEDDWQTALDLSLSDPSDYDHFFHQGCGPSVRFSDEGLRVTTPGFDDYYNRMCKNRQGDDLDMSRMFLWTRRIFQGDLWLSLEFMLHSHDGLALLVAQAAGMQGEDFLNDYPLRSSGAMSVVHREDVRNYHWEFYREMADTRNDLVSHGCFKNPWLRPMAYQVENRRWQTQQWYRLDFLQQGSRIFGAIDHTTVLDAEDSGFENSGPVLRHGRVALRAMMRTDMTFRNLRIRERPDFQSTTCS